MSGVRQYNVVVCGFGLIGGSISLDLLATKPKPQLKAVDSKKILDLVRRDRRFPVIAETNMVRAVVCADIIILSAPLKVNQRLLSKLAKIRSLENCLIVDVGSTKRNICTAGRKIRFGKGTQFVGCHPMAGTEKNGHKHAEKGLFRNNPWFVDSGVKLTKENDAKLSWLTRKLKARVVTISAKDHDRLVAVISHLPQLLSTLLAAQLSSNILKLSGPGLKSLLRLAGSPYGLWSSIIEENRDEIVDALSMYRDNLTRVISHVKKKQSLELVFNSAVRSYRCLS